MGKQYSIAQARDHLPGIVHEVERGAPVELTRRGKPVAVILSLQDYRRLSSGRIDLWQAIEPEEWLEGVRARSPGRPFEW